MVMAKDELHAVTGAFGFTGKYIARRLLQAGHRVITLTNSLHRTNPFPGQVRAFPYNFDDPAALSDSLQGASVLYNTYYVRFNYNNSAIFTYAQAVENSSKLFSAASKAGVSRIVHISITNPSEDSRFEYFRGKAKIERMLGESGISHAILRPAVLFGTEDILINNIAWLLRKFPIFGVFGDGSYRLQPIYVDDLAALAVEQGAVSENRVIDAIGPETFTYRGLVEKLGQIIGKERPIISIPPLVGSLVGKLVGEMTGDVLITRDEIEGLMTELLYVESPPAGSTELTHWAKQNADIIGRKYASELKRRLK
jgi:uncharacterized protein YbjT (DUF2867 family)